MLKILIPKICVNEYRYVLKIVFEEFLGVDYDIAYHEELFVEIKNITNDSSIIVDSVFFNMASESWLDERNMPHLPLAICDLTHEPIFDDFLFDKVPVVYGLPSIVKKEDSYEIGIDIFGSIFFLLSRYEEAVVLERDKHSRFQSRNSIAGKSGFLDRPLVDEYIEILWCCISTLWPEIKRNEKSFRKFITCDVDWPTDPYVYSIKNTIRKAASDLIRNNNLKQATKTLTNFVRHKLGLSIKDIYFENVKWIMDENERVGNKVAFYFIPLNTSSLDSQVDFTSNKISSLLKEIYNRGHEIGLHPGYNCFNNEKLFFDSVSSLRSILQNLGIQQEILGGRMHFLRWDYAVTPLLWEKHGLIYDSTLSYAETAGFRCSTANEFSMYSLIERRALTLKQRPLVSMEASIISLQYEGLQYSQESINRFLSLKNRTCTYNGLYTLLWHNSHFDFEKDKEIYKKLIE